MYYYFCSENPVAIKINGIYFCSLFNETKKIELNSDSFVEICPLSQKSYPLNFFIENLIDSTPDCVIKTNLNGGYLFKFIGKHGLGNFKIYSQQKFDDAVITVFQDNGYKISIEGKSDFYTIELNFDFSSVKINRIDNVVFCSFTLNNGYFVLGFSVKEKIKQIYSGCSDEFDITGNNFYTTEKTLSIAKYIIKCEYSVCGDNLTLVKRELTTYKHYDKKNLPKKLIPYAFLEANLYKDDYEFFLDELILSNKAKLSSYLGNYIGIMPPPPFIDENFIGLIYKESENSFYVKYISFEIFNKKIFNIKIV